MTLLGRVPFSLGTRQRVSQMGQCFRSVRKSRQWFDTDLGFSLPCDGTRVAILRPCNNIAVTSVYACNMILW
jgi:hypothetical protein